MIENLKDEITQAILKIVDPYTGKPLDIQPNRLQIAILKDQVELKISLPYPILSRKVLVQQLILDSLHSIKTLPIHISLESDLHTYTPQGQLKPLAKIKNIIGISSAKGGVGKSTMAANIAIALKLAGAEVGILDADIYGPSQPTLFGIHDHPQSPDGKTILPLVKHGVKIMSIGFLVEKDNAIIWRGPMVTQALDQLLKQTDWGNLDYLIVDLPPGTGDILLTMAQRIPMAGGVIVTTPQEIALADARRGIKMFEKMGIRILGVIENMSSFICSHCGHLENIFGVNGGELLAQHNGIPFLGKVPITSQLCQQSDLGLSILLESPQDEFSILLQDIALRAVGSLVSSPVFIPSKFPPIHVESTK